MNGKTSNFVPIILPASPDPSALLAPIRLSSSSLLCSGFSSPEIAGCLGSHSAQTSASPRLHRMLWSVVKLCLQSHRRILASGLRSVLYLNNFFPFLDYFYTFYQPAIFFEPNFKGRWFSAQILWSTASIGLQSRTGQNLSRPTQFLKPQTLMRL